MRKMMEEREYKFGVGLEGVPMNLKSKPSPSPNPWAKRAKKSCLRHPSPWFTQVLNVIASNRKEVERGVRRRRTQSETFLSGGSTNKSTSMAAKASPLGLPKSGAISKGYNFASRWEQVRSSFPIYSSFRSILNPEICFSLFDLALVQIPLLNVV